MSIVPEKEEVLVALREQEPNENNDQPFSHVGDVAFLWKLMVSTQASQGKWRVQMTLQSDSIPVRSFESNPLEVALNELATITFPVTGGTTLPDSFWVERFESVRHTSLNNGNARGESPQPEVQFRLIPNDTGTKPKYIVVENTSMTIFWIIGARNIILTEIN